MIGRIVDRHRRIDPIGRRQVEDERAGGIRQAVHCEQPDADSRGDDRGGNADAKDCDCLPFASLPRQLAALADLPPADLLPCLADDWRPYRPTDRPKHRPACGVAAARGGLARQWLAVAAAAGVRRGGWR